MMINVINLLGIRAVYRNSVNHIFINWNYGNTF